MSNYTKTTDFQAKDSLPAGDSNKVIRGSEFETEFDNIATAVNSKADTANATLTGTTTFETISDGVINVTAFVDEDNMASNSATLVPTQQSVKSYVDSQITANNELSEVLSNGNTTGGSNISFGDNDKAVFGAGSDLQIFHDGSNSYIEDAGTGTLSLKGSAAVYVQATGTNEYMASFSKDGPVQLYHNNSVKFGTTSTGIDVTGVITTDGMTTSADINFGDNDKAKFGAGSDLQIYHDGVTGNSFIKESGSGHLVITADDFRIQPVAEDRNWIAGDTNGAVELYYNGSQKLATTSAGIDVTGTVLSDGLRFGTATDHTIKWGSGAEILAIGSADQSVHIRLDPNSVSNFGNFKITDGSSDKFLFHVDDSGDISFYEDTGTTAKLTWDASAESLNFADNGKAIFGAGSDLQIYHDGSNSYIVDNGTGNLVLEGGNLRIRNVGSSQNFITADNGGATNLFYAGTPKLSTTSTGIDVSGTATIDGLTVDGSATVRVSGAGSTAEALAIYNTNGTSNNSQVQLYFGANDYDTTGRGLRIDAGRDSAADGIATFYSVDQAEHSDYEAIKILTDGGVTLSHLGDNKLATTSSGIDVTGTVTADAGSTSLVGTLKTTADNSGLAYADSNQTLILKNDHASGTARLKFLGTASESGSITFGGGVGATSDTFVIRPRVMAGGKAFNISGGGDVSLYEDTGTTAKFFWDASAESLGIGTSAPARELEITGTGNVYARITAPTASDSTALELVNTGETWTIRNDDTNSDALEFGTSGGTHLVIDTSGQVGIGTSSPDELLHLSGGTNCILKLDTRDTGLSLDQELGVVQFYQNDSTAGGTGVGAKIRGRSTYRASSGTYFGNGMALDFNVSSDAVNSNANVTAMSIIPGGNVGIGTSSPQTLLDVSEFGGTPTIRITNSDGTFSAGQDIGKFEFFCNDQSTPGARVASYILSQAAGTQGGGDLQFATSANGGTVTERMRIDASGNLLVGKTASSYTTVGAEVKPNGRLFATASGDTPLLLNRLSADGTIANFRKDGTTVGSIRTISGDSIGIGNGDAGLRFVSSTNRIQPVDMDNGLNSDALTSLGDTNKRFKDLYLSGGVYLGGTGSANKLDDYEEGTWTPVYGGSTTAGTGTYTRQSGVYVKAGNLVYASGTIGISAHTGSGNAQITGLPFGSFNSTGNYAAVSISFNSGHTTTSGYQIIGFVQIPTNTINLWETGGTGQQNPLALDTGFAELDFTIVYRAS
jgi:hypothetical protein